MVELFKQSEQQQWLVKEWMQNHSAATILFLTITQRAGNEPSSSKHHGREGFLLFFLISLLVFTFWFGRRYFGEEGLPSKDFNI